MSTIEINELNLDDISPNESTYMLNGRDDPGGSKIIVIGKPKTGKTTLICSLLYHKRNIIPTGIVVCGTEDSSGTYNRIFPSSFIYNKYDESIMEKFIIRQKTAKKYIENPWAVCLLDDCTDNPGIFRKTIQQGFFKNGRHWKMLYIVSLQYCMDILPVIRSTVDGVFILREASVRIRKSLYENYASIIPDFLLFCELMDKLTDDYTAIFIKNLTNTNKWQECVFWYKAKPCPDDFKFGCPEMWKFHNERYNDEYTDIYN